MWVVIDTNIFFEDFRIKKSLDLLFKNIENVHFSLRIPEIVVKETVNKYKEKRQVLLSKLASSSKELKSLTSLEFNVDTVQENLAKDLQEYEHYLREKITSNGEIVPLPNISIQDLIERDLGRRKPFKEHGVGFRDTLIWETILNLTTREGCEGIIFITKNTEDFSDNNNLHPDLIQDLNRIGVNPNIVRLFVSVETFIESIVLPALNDIGEIRDAIVHGTHADIDLEEITERYIWDLITGFEVDPACLPKFSEENSDLALSFGVSEYEILADELSVKKLSNNELLLTVSYKMDCELDVFVPQWEAYGEEFRELGFHISEPDWNETYVLASIVLPFKVTLRYVYNQENAEITSADIISAECLREEND
jgi:hypothetical protein